MLRNDDEYYDEAHPLHDSDSDDDANNHHHHRHPQRQRPFPTNQQNVVMDLPQPMLLDLQGTKCRIHPARRASDDHLLNYFERCCSFVSSEIDEKEEVEEPLLEENDENNNSNELWMDRYDVRTLLEEYSTFRRKPKCDADFKDEDEEDDDLNRERYCLLPEFQNQTKDDNEKSSQSPQKSEEEEEEDENEEVLEWTEEERQSFPADMILPFRVSAVMDHLQFGGGGGEYTPETKRQNQIIQMTARRSAIAPQFEVLLKLKQTQNHQFGFLNSEHRLHPYYLFWKRRIGKDEKEGDLEEKGDGLVPYDSSEEEKGGGMVGLLGMYSSSDEEEEDDLKKNVTQKERSVSFREKACHDTDETGSQKSNNEEQQSQKRNAMEEDLQAKRLKRARSMKQHFALKMMD